MARQKKVGEKKIKVADAITRLNSLDFKIFGKPGINKGSRGQMIERALGLNLNGDLLDFEDGELKTFKVGETIFVTQLQHCLHEIIEDKVDFANSKLGKKLQKTIFVGFDKIGNFKNSYVVDCSLQIDHFKKLELDFEDLSKKIRDAFEDKRTLNTKADNLNGPNMLLQIRTKGSPRKDKTYSPMIYKGHQFREKHMAFYLRADFGRMICSLTE